MKISKTVYDKKYLLNKIHDVILIIYFKYFHNNNLKSDFVE